jgi:4-hydroxy-3-methylbut-2-enyl diphosphate reductase
VVVGGRNSANTNRLRDIAVEMGLPAFLVETTEDLDVPELKKYDRVLLTAGASTPSWSIRRVRERLLEIQGSGLRSGPVRRMLRALVFSNFHVLPVAFAVGAAGEIISGTGNWIIPALASSLFLFGSHSMTSVLESGYSRPSAIRRQDFLRRHRRLFTASSITAFAGSMALSLLLEPVWTTVLGIMLIAFLAYSFPLMRGASPFRGLRAIPGSRDVMFAGAWSFLLAFLPGFLAFGGRIEAGPILWAGTLFFLFLARCLLADLTDLQGDALMGLDTIPIHAGLKRSVLLFWLCTALAALLPATGIAAGFLPPESAAFGLGLLSLCTGFFVLRSASFPSELFKRGVADGSLLAAGLAPAILCWMQR